MATTAYGWDSFFSTTLSSAITASDTTIPLVAAPTATEGVLVIEPDSSTNREIIYYTGVSGSSVTLPSVGAGRGQEGTTAAAHSSGVVVKRNTTSRDFEVLQDGTAVSAGAIIPNKLVSGTGTSWAWQSWTPTWTNLTVSGSTVTAAYTQIGKTVHFRVQVVLAAGNAPSGAVSFTLPVTANSAYTATNNETQFAAGSALDFGTGAFQLIGRFTSADGATKCNVVVANAGASYTSHTAVSSTVPMTWANSDILSMNGTYEAA